MALYEDDPATSVDEGATAGDEIRFEIIQGRCCLIQTPGMDDDAREPLSRLECLGTIAKAWRRLEVGAGCPCPIPKLAQSLQMWPL